MVGCAWIRGWTVVSHGLSTNTRGYPPSIKALIINEPVFFGLAFDGFVFILKLIINK